MLTVALPKDSAGQPLRDRALIDWAWVLLAQVYGQNENSTAGLSA